MPKCSVISCPNNTRYVRKKDGVSYFSFPRNPIRCSGWAVIIGKARNELNYKPYKGSVVCSNHFPASDIYTTTKGFSRLDKNAKPILNLNSDQDSTHVNPGHDNNQQTIEQNEDSTKLTFDIDDEIGKSGETNMLCLQEEIPIEFEQSPSTSTRIGSILDTPRKIVMERKLNLCENIIRNKNRQINRLQKQNKRLIKKNITLKNVLIILKKKLQRNVQKK